MPMVYVTLLGDSVAVSQTQTGAEEILAGLLKSEAEQICYRAEQAGEVHKSVRIRTCYVMLNK